MPACCGQVQVLQHGLGLLIEIGQRRALVLQLQQGQLALADRLLPGADVAAIDARRLGSASRCFRSNRPMALVSPTVSTFSRTRLNWSFSAAELLVDLLQLAGGVDDVLGQRLPHLGQGGVLFGQPPHGRMGLAGLPRGLPHLLLGLLLPPPVDDLLPLLDFLLGQGDPPGVEVAAQRQQLGPRFEAANSFSQQRISCSAARRWATSIIRRAESTGELSSAGAGA